MQKAETSNTVIMHMGIDCLHWTQTSRVDGMDVLQNGQGVRSSSGSIEPFGGRRTVLSIFFLYLASSWSRYSGLIRMAAYWKAAFLSPARSHSITVEVRMGTTSVETKFQVSFLLKFWKGSVNNSSYEKGISICTQQLGSATVQR